MELLQVLSEFESALLAVENRETKLKINFLPFAVSALATR